MKRIAAARKGKATSIGWLHLSDLHHSVGHRGWMAPRVRQQVEDDLAKLHERAGPWDLVIVAGDLSLRGAPEDLEEAERSLETLLDHVRRLGGPGSDPCLLVVPGNHDLLRPRDISVPAFRALRRWHQDPSVREEFWNDLTSPVRRLVDRALEPFEHWWNKRQFPEHVRVRRGLLPGDFTATLEKEGVRFGVAGLCSAFLQLTGDDYEGRLGLDPLQLTIAAGGDISAWVTKHDAAVLVTHHPPGWLAPEDRRRYEAQINPGGRFCAHLSGHLHDAALLVERGEPLQVRAPSFFGMRAWEGSNSEGTSRRFGYSAARLEIDRTASRLRVFARVRTGTGFRAAAGARGVGGAVTLPIARFPRIAENAPPLLLERIALRDAFAAVCHSPEELRALARAGGVRLGSELEAHAIIDLLHVVVSEAARRGKLEHLVQSALLTYPDEAAIAAAWTVYKRATPPGTAMKSGSEGDRPLDGLYARLMDLQPPAFEAVLSLTDLAERVPGPRLRQSARAAAALQEAEQQGRSGLTRLGTAILAVSGAALPRLYGSLKSASIVIGGLLGGSVALLAAKGDRPSRTPTRASLVRLLRAIFPDERDFDGFVLDQFTDVYRRFTNGMNRDYRVQLLLEKADPLQIVARLKRAHPSALAAHERLLDYEEKADMAAASRFYP